LWALATPLEPLTLLGKLTALAMMGIAGGLGGTALGSVQLLLLRRKLPRLRAREWLGTTISVTILGFLMGLGVALFGRGVARLTPDTPLGRALFGGAAIGAAAGLCFGIAQWLVLRRHAQRAGQWILVHVSAWAAAIGVIWTCIELAIDPAQHLPALWGGLAGALFATLILGLFGTLAVPMLRPWVPRSPEALRGKVALITGSNSGIGYELALGLGRLGAKVVLLCRDEIRGAAAASAIRVSVRGADVRTVVCDLASFASIRAAATRLLADGGRIDILIHNAGASFAERTTSADGLEATLAVDVVGPFLLTSLLRERLERCEGRVIMLADLSHREGEINLADLHFIRREYDGHAAHAQAQRGRVLVAAEQGKRAGRLSAVAVYPGAARTQALLRAPLITRLLAATLLRPRFMRAELGALPVLRLALLPLRELPSGRFLDRFSVQDDVPDAAFAQAFVRACEKMTAEKSEV
jgi:NAD(P)-dependent dehydrogenase (short-subunit alcohol dehydrogenase family)